MQTLVVQDSPLASYLEGSGEADPDLDTPSHTTQHDTPTSPSTSFAPRGLPTFLARLALPPAHHHGPMSTLRNLYALAVTSTLGHADNERFLEHFRYILIASQLLDHHVGHAASHSALPLHSSLISTPPTTDPADLGTTTLTGAAASAFAAFLLVYLLDCARDPAGSFVLKRLVLVVLLLALAAVIFYAFVRRHWLKYLRGRAIDTAAAFVASLQTFENVSASLLTFIQEVELISRGYRISHPLPPISRLEGRAHSSRKCARLRTHLHQLLLSTLPALTAAVDNLRVHVNETDLDRFLEVYDISQDDMLEAFAAPAEGYAALDGDGDDAGSLKQLRIHQHRLSLLRRVFLCSLLAVPATGRKSDAVRWRAVITQMENLLALFNDLIEGSSKLLAQEDQPPQTPASPTNSQYYHQQQILRMSTLSTGIRSLQAKLYLLGQGSTPLLSASASETDLPHLSASLREQYDSIGADLRALMQAWESGRQSLLDDISKAERRVSLGSAEPSSGMPQTTPPPRRPFRHSLSPLSATRTRFGGHHMSPDLHHTSMPVPLSPPTSESGDSEHELNGSTKTNDTVTAPRDRQIFEAISAPPASRMRSSLSREQRIIQMQEERQRQRQLKEKREATSNMIRELQNVIRLRPGSDADAEPVSPPATAPQHSIPTPELTPKPTPDATPEPVKRAATRCQNPSPRPPSVLGPSDTPQDSSHQRNTSNLPVVPPERNPPDLHPQQAQASSPALLPTLKPPLSLDK